MLGSTLASGCGGPGSAPTGLNTPDSAIRMKSLPPAISNGATFGDADLAGVFLSLAGTPRADLALKVRASLLEHCSRIDGRGEFVEHEQLQLVHVPPQRSTTGCSFTREGFP